MGLKKDLIPSRASTRWLRLRELSTEFAARLHADKIVVLLTEFKPHVDEISFRRFAAEAWRRAEAGELADDELYAGDAQWSGLYDRMHTHEPDETERRLELAATFAEAVEG